MTTYNDILQHCSKGFFPSVKIDVTLRHCTSNFGKVVVIKDEPDGFKGCAVRFEGMNWNTWFYANNGSDKRKHYISELTIISPKDAIIEDIPTINLDVLPNKISPFKSGNSFYIANQQKLYIQKLFPNKSLSLEEFTWVQKYISFFGFEPIQTEDVNDETSFYEMTKANLNWLDDFISDGKNIIENYTRALPYFELFAYK